MAFVVVYDACVLYPAPVRDLLIRVAQADIVRGRWSNQILDEVFTNLARDRPDIPQERLDRTRRLMCEAVRDCMVSGYEPLIDAIVLPDLKDRHVVAAAIRAGAQVIVTFNTKDFPAAALSQFNVEAKHPDDFLLESIDIAPGRVVRIVIEQAADLLNPQQSPGEVLHTLAKLGLGQSAARLQAQPE